jgi:hypothetical protein
MQRGRWHYTPLSENFIKRARAITRRGRFYWYGPISSGTPHHLPSESSTTSLNFGASLAAGGTHTCTDVYSRENPHTPSRSCPRQRSNNSS